MFIEDCLLLLLDQQNQTGSDETTIDSGDYTLLNSFANQIKKGIALTDRQHALLKIKLINYREQFINIAQIDLDACLDTLKMPLRIIDRSKYVKINNKDILIYFPFNKKIINTITAVRNAIGNDNFYFHKKGTHFHYFSLNEQTIYHVVDAFKEKNFDIDQELLNAYEKIDNIFKNPEDYVPGIVDYKIKNCHHSAVEYMETTLGKPDVNNIALYKDRQKLLGLHYFKNTGLTNSIVQHTTLSQKIINRNKASVFLNNKNWTFDAIVESLLNLNRFPLLLLINNSSNDNLNSSIDELSYTHQSLKNIIDSKDISVLFRQDNINNKANHFNTYIHNYNLNNPVAKNTKVVYISSNNLPKLLLNTDWRPLTVINISGELISGNLKKYITLQDLIIYYDNHVSEFLANNSNTHFTQGIEIL